jgi:rhodanese-related sulfurtransferase
MQELVDFSNQNPWLVSGLVASALAVIFYELRLQSRNIGNLSTSMAIRVINDGSAVVDVRSADQFASGHIVDARNIPAPELLASADTLSKHKKGTVLVCDNGARSAECAAKLRKDGIESVYSLKGGVLAWQQENLPIVSDGSAGKDRASESKGT